MITVNSPSDPNERWIINDGKVEKWFLDHEGVTYLTLRKTRNPNPNVSRIMARKEYVFATEQEARKAEGLE